jgi:lactoylglutathione lyase
MQRVIEQLVEAFERGGISRREMIGGLTAMVAAAGASAGGTDGTPQDSTFQAVGLNHIALHVTDIPRSRAFYIRHLGMSVMSESASSSFLRCGDNFVALFRNSTAGLAHYCYSVEGYTAGGAEEKLRAEALEPRVEGNRIYFPDPDGLTVQLAAPRV